MVPGQGTPEYEKRKLEGMSRAEKDAKIASAKEMLDKGHISQKHFDVVAANLK